MGDIISIIRSSDSYGKLDIVFNGDINIILITRI